MDLRKRTRIVAAASGLTFRQLASSLGLAYSTFYNWISGQSELGEESQIKLRKLLKEVEENEQ